MAVLLTAGQSIVTLDDDVLCDVSTCESKSTNLALVGHADPRQSWWFGSRHEAIAAVRSAPEEDVITLHERLLGRTLAASAAEAGATLDASQACPHILQAVSRSGAKVRASWLGVVGDAGVYCPHAGLFVDGNTRNRLAATEEAFRLALRSREVVRLVSSPTITDEARLMLYCAGIDNSSLVPPFLPMGANEDGLFSALLRLSDSQAFVAQMPYAVVHDSSRPSLFEHAGIKSASEVRLADLMLGVLRPWSVSCAQLDLPGRMRSLGKYLGGITSMSDGDFRHHIRNVVLQQKWRAAARCDEIQADSYAYPSYWKQALGDYRESVFASLGKDDFYVPVECTAPGAAPLKSLHYQMKMFGEALEVWPDLWQCARDNREELRETARVQEAAATAP